MQKLVEFFKSKRFLFLWLAAFALNIITFLVILFKNGLHGPNVALRYNVKAGVFWYGRGTNLYVIPILGLMLNGSNLFLFKKLAADQNFLQQTLAFTSLLIQLLLFISSLFLAGVN